MLLCAFSDLPKDNEWRDSISAPFFESIALMGTPYLPEFLAKQVKFDHNDTALPLGALPPAGNNATRNITDDDANRNPRHNPQTKRASIGEPDHKGSLKKDKADKNEHSGSLKKQKEGAKKRANKSNPKQSP